MKPYIKVKSLSLLRPLSLSVTSAKAACACELDTERASDYHYCLSKQKSHGEEIPATKRWTTYRSFIDLTQDSDDADRGDDVQVVPSSGCSIISLIFFRVIFYESILPKQGRFYLENFYCFYQHLLRLPIPSTSSFSTLFKNVFSAVTWCCLHATSKTSKAPLAKTVTMTVCVNEPLTSFDKCFESALMAEFIVS